jgi:hypothetical protein
MYVVVDPQAARHANARMYATPEPDRFPFIACAPSVCERRISPGRRD